jgi:serpin B
LVGDLPWPSIRPPSGSLACRSKERTGAGVTGLHEVDFRGATEKARQTIDAWVQKQTEDKIKDLLRQGVLKPDTRLVLTNAIYFKGDWARQFKKDRTRQEPFHLGACKTVKAPLMHQTGKFGYFEADRCQALQLPYAGKDLAMVVLLPKKADGLADLEKELTASGFRKMTGNSRPLPLSW